MGRRWAVDADWGAEIKIKSRSRIGRGRLRGCNGGKENWLGMGEPWAVDGMDRMDLVDGRGRTRTGRWGAGEYDYDPEEE